MPPSSSSSSVGAARRLFFLASCAAKPLVFFSAGAACGAAARFFYPGPSNDATASDSALSELTGGSPPSRPFVRVSTTYASSWDPATRTPRWVAERLTAASLAGSAVGRAGQAFHADDAVPPALRAERGAISGGRYDRGHLAPAADARTRDGVAETFLLTNVVPQDAQLNRSYWARLEAYARGLAARHAAVYVVTGPLFLPVWRDGAWRYGHEALGSAAAWVAVPTHLFKALLVVDADGAPRGAGAFVLPNEPIAAETPLASFAVPLAALESAGGLELFRGLLPDGGGWRETDSAGGGDDDDEEEGGGGGAAPAGGEKPRRRRRGGNPRRAPLPLADNSRRLLAPGYPGPLSAHAAPARAAAPPRAGVGGPRLLHLCALDACRLPPLHAPPPSTTTSPGPQ